MFKVKDRDTGNIVTVRAVLPHGILMDKTKFLVYENHNWHWIDSSYYIPIEETEM